jgi:hypothetical protein
VEEKIPALFVTYGEFFSSKGGGVQLCSREYRDSLERAGFTLDILPFALGKSLTQRVRRRIFPEVSLLSSAALSFDRLRQKVTESQAEFVFFNHTPFPDLSRQLARDCPQVKQVLLSHGVDAIDFLIAQSARRRSHAEDLHRAVADSMLGRTLFAEAELRASLYAVLTLSEFEVQVERWLGTRKVLWVPRMVSEPALDWKPLPGRVGCVSTLDHPPNLQGLEELFAALEGLVPADLEFRLVGRPERQGERLAARYRFLRYLGPLDDAGLRAEVASWCCFVHPLFVLAKGCSTKLAVALGWGIPLATSEAGARGYVWDEERLPLARSPSELAELVLARANAAPGAAFRQQTQAIAALAPSADEIARRIRRLLVAQPRDRSR